MVKDTLQACCDKARTNTHMVQGNHHTHLLYLTPTTKREVPGTLESLLTPASTRIRIKKNKNNPHSCILNEAVSHFMKKTMYLSNKTKSVQQFTSLAKTKAENFIKMDQQLAKMRADLAGRDECNAINLTFDATNAISRANTSKRKRLVHPTKKHPTLDWDHLILSDLQRWRYMYTHVILDHPPKSAVMSKKRRKKGEENNKNKDKEKISTALQLKKAMVVDVMKRD